MDLGSNESFTLYFDSFFFIDNEGELYISSSVQR